MTPSIPTLPALVEAAHSWPGEVQPPGEFTPAAGEVVFFAGEAVELVELRDTLPPLVGGSSGFEYATAAAMAVVGHRFTRGIWLHESVPARDTGWLVITDRRVVLQGSRVREWPLDRVVDVTHDDGTPETWLTTSHRKRVSGFRYTGASAVQVRFCLALAMAEARGQRPMLAADLSAQARSIRPVAPAVPTQAPTLAPVPAQLPAHGPVPPPLPVSSSGFAALAGRAALGRPEHALPRRIARGAATALVGLVLLAVALPDPPAGPESTPTSAQATRNDQAARTAEQDRARAAAEQLATEQAASDRAEAERAASEQAAADQAAADKAAAAKAAEDKATADKAAADAAAQAKATADRATADLAAADRAAAAKAASDREAADRAAAEAAAAAAREAPQTLAAAPSGAGCHESYPDFCIPASGGDVDCGELTQTNFTALEPDPYRLDREGDGVACES